MPRQSLTSASGAERPDIRRMKQTRLFLRAWLQYRRTLNAQFSVRLWAKEMGMKNHSLLSLLLSGKRDVRMAHLPKLLLGMDLSEEEAMLLKGKVEIESSAENPSLQAILQRSQGLPAEVSESPSGPGTWEVSDAELLCKPEVLFLLSLAHLPGWDGTAQAAWQLLHSSTRNAFTPAALQIALDRLVAEGWLQKRGGRMHVIAERIATTNDVASTVVQNYHRQSLSEAARHAPNLPVTDRELQAFTFPARVAQIPALKAIVRECRNRLIAASELPAADHQGKDTVFQVNLALYPLSR